MTGITEQNRHGTCNSGIANDIAVQYVGIERQYHQLMATICILQ